MRKSVKEILRSQIIGSVEAAKLFGVHPKTMWEWAKTGKIESVLVGRDYIFDRKEITAMVASGYKWGKVETLKKYSRSRKTHKTLDKLELTYSY